MYGRLTLASVKPELFEEARQICHESFISHASKQPGYRGFLFFKNPETNQLMGISLWDDEASMNQSAGDDGYYVAALKRFGETASAPPISVTMELDVIESVTLKGGHS